MVRSLHHKLSRLQASLRSFVAGCYAAPAKNIDRPRQLKGDRYDVLWLYLIRERQGIDACAQLASDASAFSGAKWPQPVIEYCLGRLNEDGLLAAAATPCWEKATQQRCEADFDIGEAQLLHHHTGPAKGHFERARRECPPGFFELTGAVVELKRLGG